MEGFFLTALTLNSMYRKGKLTLGIDSSAAVTIIPSSNCNDYPLVKSSYSKSGGYTRASNGAKIYDEGCRENFFRSDTGDTRGLRSRVWTREHRFVTCSRDCGFGSQGCV